jgi:hypothetical protein
MQVMVVFDADMVARPNFYTKILEVMLDDDCALCLTPQGFSNVDAQRDIFNNLNLSFWEYMLPGEHREDSSSTDVIQHGMGLCSCTNKMQMLLLLVTLNAIATSYTDCASTVRRCIMVCAMSTANALLMPGVLAACVRVHPDM